MSVLSAADDPASDSDADAPAYEADYCPISADADSDDDHGSGHIPTALSNGGDLAPHLPPDPGFPYDRPENGVSRLDLSGEGMRAGEEELEEEEEEEEEEAEHEEREREASISRAFREDESRRNAPLTRENAARIVEAMRVVSFPGCPPDWADRVPEDRWLDHLQRLRLGEESAPAPQS